MRLTTCSKLPPSSRTRSRRWFLFLSKNTEFVSCSTSTRRQRARQRFDVLISEKKLIHYAFSYTSLTTGAESSPGSRGVPSVFVYGPVLLPRRIREINRRKSHVYYTPSHVFYYSSNGFWCTLPRLNRVLIKIKRKAILITQLQFSELEKHRTKVSIEGTHLDKEQTRDTYEIPKHEES